MIANIHEWIPAPPFAVYEIVWGEVDENVNCVDDGFDDPELDNDIITEPPLYDVGRIVNEVAWFWYNVITIDVNVHWINGKTVIDCDEGVKKA